MKNLILEDLSFIKTRADIPTFLTNVGAEKICEVGVAEGYNFNRLLVSNLKLAVAVDIWKITDIKSQNDYPFSQEQKDSFYNNMVELSKKDSRVKVVRDFSINASKQFEDNFFDFVYIDADHTYEAVYKDLCAWYPKVRPGGVLAGHDYFENKTEDLEYGVIKALNRFREENNLPIHVDEAGWYDWFIPKPFNDLSNKFPVILIMTVKNEEHIIHRCLDSVLPYVDGVAIAVDSKTTDNTLSHSINLAKRYNKPYKIELVECKFMEEFQRVDISDARNKSIILAEELISNKFSDKKCYLLFVDADERLIFNSEDPFAPLDGINNFNFIKKYPNGYRSYSHLQLFLANNGYYWKDPIHEYIDQKSDYPKLNFKNIDTFYLDFQHLGARSKDPNKVYKDIALMKYVIDNRPNDNRMQYYLALAYKEAGLKNEEAEVYKLLVKNPNSLLEEKWYAYINLAHISPKEQFMFYMLQAYNLINNRAEPLYELIKFCRNEGMNKQAYEFGKLALKINKPPVGSFYLSEDVYDWKLKDEVSLAAYYDGDHVTSYNLCEELLNSGLTPKDQIERIKNNKRFATKNYVTNKPTIAIFVENDIEWTIQKKIGFGGSEVRLLELAKFLKQGYAVTVYCKTQEEGFFDGIGYINNRNFNIDCDILISFRDPKCFERVRINCKKAYLWLHDIYIHTYITQNDVNRFNKILVLSNSHKDAILEHHNFIDNNKFSIVRNGISDICEYKKDIPRNPHKAVYTSSAGRGLDVACMMWGKVREQVPDAELHVFYGFDYTDLGNNPEKQRFDFIKQLLAITPGIVNHGKVPKEQLVDELLSAGVWCYPTWFKESSSLAAMEAQTAGLNIVTSNLSSLKETIGDRGIFVDGKSFDLWTGEYFPDYQDRFIPELVKALNTDNPELRKQIQEYAFKNFDYNIVVFDWIKLFCE